MKWEDLSFKERVEIIKTGVSNGLKDIDSIKDAYTKFAEGGLMDNDSPDDPPYVQLQNQLRLPTVNTYGSYDFGAIADSFANNNANNTRKPLPQVQMYSRNTPSDNTYVRGVADNQNGIVKRDVLQTQADLLEQAKLEQAAANNGIIYDPTNKDVLRAKAAEHKQATSVGSNYARSYTPQDINNLEQTLNAAFWAVDPIGMAAYEAVNNSPKIFDSNNRSMTDYAQQELGINPFVSSLVLFPASRKLATGFGNAAYRAGERAIETSNYLYGNPNNLGITPQWMNAGQKALDDVIWDIKMKGRKVKKQLNAAERLSKYKDPFDNPIQQRKNTLWNNMFDNQERKIDLNHNSLQYFTPSRDFGDFNFVETGPDYTVQFTNPLTQERAFASINNPYMQTTKKVSIGIRPVEYPYTYAYYDDPYIKLNISMPEKVGSTLDRIGEGGQPKELSNAIDSYLQDIRKQIPEDAGLAGSSLLYSKGLAKGVPNDMEFIVLQEDLPALEKAMDGKFEKREGRHQFNQHDVVRSSKAAGKEGTYDAEIVFTNENGQPYGTVAHEIYSTLHPDEYAAYRQAYAKEKLIDGDGDYTSVKQNELPLPISGRELMREYNTGDNALKVQIANHLSSVKPKHVNRIPTILTNKEYTGLARQVIIDKGRSVIPGYQSLEEAYPNIRFNDVEGNKQFLKRLGYPEKYASDPEIMATIAEKVHYDAIHGRSVAPKDKIEGSNESIETRAFSITAGETVAGAGGNSTLGNSPSTVYGALTFLFQRHFNKSKINSPLDLIKETDRIDRVLNMPLQKDDLNNVKKIFKNYFDAHRKEATIPIEDLAYGLNHLKGIGDIDKLIVKMFDPGYLYKNSGKPQILAKIDLTQQIADELGIRGAIGKTYHERSGRYFGIYDKKFDTYGYSANNGSREGLSYELGRNELEVPEYINLQGDTFYNLYNKKFYYKDFLKNGYNETDGFSGVNQRFLDEYFEYIPKNEREELQQLMKRRLDEISRVRKYDQLSWSWHDTESKLLNAAWKAKERSSIKNYKEKAALIGLPTMMAGGAGYLGYRYHQINKQQKLEEEKEKNEINNKRIIKQLFKND